MQKTPPSAQTYLFRSLNASLLAVYHPPWTSTPGHETGVVIASSVGQEYIRSHRALAGLAGHMASSGLHVLRFDFYGCGDSAGDCMERSVATCIQNLCDAITELREGAGIARTGVLGVRLGATIGLLAGARTQIDALALWGPVTDGKQYLHEICEHHRAHVRGTYGVSDTGEREGREVLGFEISGKFIEELSELSIEKLHPTMPLVAIDSESTAVAGLTHNSPLPVERLELGLPKLWLRTGAGRDALSLPRAGMETITKWFTTNLR